MSKLADNLELAARIVRDPTLQWEFMYRGVWVSSEMCTDIKNAIYMEYDIRLKPTPQYVPWSLKTHPEGVVWVRRKDEVFQKMLTLWGSDDVILSPSVLISYQGLFDNYTLLDGSPCGTLSSTMNVED